MKTATEAMEAVCSDGLLFASSDTEGFSKAVNNAIGAAWGVYTLTDTVDPAFALVADSIAVTAGETSVSEVNGNTVITWTIYGNPFNVETLTYRLDLKQNADTSYPTGVLDTNEGSADIFAGVTPEGTTVNNVATPQLTRTPLRNALVVSKTVEGGGSTTTDFTFTVTLSDSEQHDVIRTSADGTSAAAGTIANGGTFTLKSGESVVICDLPIGTDYTVTEIQETNYTISVSAIHGTVCGRVVTGEIPQSGEAAVAHYTNTYTGGGGSSGGGGGGSTGGNGSSRPSRPTLNTEDHYSYIIGYSDGYLRPYGTITRGEVATIFFRLLTDDSREEYWSQVNDYSDCSSDLWCNNAISTLTNMGIIDGFSDGTFRPYARITRAQFAKIAVGFFETTREDYQGYFTDVDIDAWYTEYVEAAARVGLIEGFSDGTFRPNTNITRAQACVIVNRALGRAPDEDRLLDEDEMITWPDNNPDDWFYADMQEATNSHDYTWTTVSGERVENWTDKLAQRDWAALEHAWSTAHSAPGGEVTQ